MVLIRCGGLPSNGHLPAGMASGQHCADERENELSGFKTAEGLHQSKDYPAKAKSIIFLYMDGGPSQVDTFDPKPRLNREHGEPIKMHHPPTQFIPHDSPPKVLGSPFKFQQHGQSGTPVSEIFPHLATCVDDLAIVRSTVADFTVAAERLRPKPPE